MSGHKEARLKNTTERQRMLTAGSGTVIENDRLQNRNQISHAAQHRVRLDG